MNRCRNDFSGTHASGVLSMRLRFKARRRRAYPLLIHMKLAQFKIKDSEQQRLGILIGDVV